LEGELPDFDLASEVSGRQFHGKAIVYAERDCRAPDTRGWPERGIRDVPFPGEPISRGSPVCTVLATRSTREDCYASLVAKAEEVKGELYA
jgi:predicted ATP-grasp superfamily ATP-dependent carboligase